MHRTSRWTQCKRAIGAGSLALALAVGAPAALAADPFRTGSEARPIGPALQMAFEDFFKNGNYLNAGEKLDVAQRQNPDEPLVYGLQAAIAYQNGQVDRLLALAQKTREVAQAMNGKDPARSHLYLGIAQGLEISTFYLKDGILALPRMLTQVPGMFGEFKTAREKAPDDPEINLFVGYIDTLLTKHDEAIKQFRKAAPNYLSYRGQALAWRDKKNYEEALAMVDQALAAAPTNPDLFYLKGQILALYSKPAEAVAHFDRAIYQGNQLPEGTRKQILRERDAQARLAGDLYTPLPSVTVTPQP
ncbi:Sll0314/Alr1548 family TPR repeat-containing protein [Gloeobacter morelensis]|uniref:Tetratricopeptide repeat protein n=1 Tax=Gloeobacter morelensis MG652769 TaxID=2781736 RepID=A0ABY3PP88_9CYAN|nr:Sll0314/Alr1548 family TPR repeat-containing protein [Gloeobacter morelensis]UFP95501.1 tetratricopeptide repeat protein [Gloeobacter morelensis MG652769]